MTLALQTLPMLVIGAWAGVIADRVDCRRILQITAVCGAVQAIGLGAITAIGHVTVAWIWVFAFILGINTAFERPACDDGACACGAALPRHNHTLESR